MTAVSRGRSLELFFIDGRPDGMLTAEVFNWTGHVLMTPRTQISEALRRKEAGYTGIYLLLGEKDGQPLAYIGEAEDVSDRIRNHETKMEWWNSAILITSTANNLNKAHVRYLEARLIEEARAADKISLENRTAPSPPRLTESAQANMETFLENILMILPALRIDSLLKDARPQPPSGGVTFELHSSKHGLRAIATLIDEEFIVHEGSLARKSWESSGHENSSYGRLYAELVRTGILQDQSEHRVFSQNYAFRSPSAAASVVKGQPAAGTTEWKVQGQNKTYKQWEADQVARDSAEVSEQSPSAR